MNFGIIVIIFIAGLWALSLLFGGLTKSFSHAPSAIDSSSVRQQAQQSIEQTKEKQQELMDEMKQKIQDEQARKF
ncbi:MAG: hypothetical protein KGJ09_06840 [Candidatus Omnitrophica bacterium]|nr:hypothetical protein [Candidatus Omnitrophota bacterium]MDE2009781.1 hypothetical protein [Candidatus Omnitrophota bacterium]MDE2215126.1 hypothetical protein [Candidatus Omnitrophota bacterium]MDE2231480.1 hypothetical protein [Candidatus Omnitrophota bacterium]